MKHVAFLGVLLLLVLTAAGCTHAEPRGAGHPSRPASSPASRPASAKVAPPHLRVLHRFHLGSRTEAIAGNAERLVFGSQRPGDLDASSVMSLDLRTGAQTRVGHSEFRRGMVNWAGASGDWTVFTDQSHTQGDGGMDVLWRVVAVNPRLHVRKVLLSNGNKPDPWVPWLGSEADYVFWSSAEADAKRTAHEWVFRDGWTTPRTLLRHAALTPGSESIAGDRVVYLGPNASTAPGRHVGGDCWAVPLRGGDPVPLTHSGLASGCATDETWVVWYELIAPEASPPPEGRDDNPYELWAQRLDLQEPVLLHRGYMAGGWPLAQRGFALYLGDDGNPVVQDLEDPRSHLRMPETGWDLGARVGDRVALPHPVGHSRDQYVDIVELSRR